MTDATPVRQLGIGEVAVGQSVRQCFTFTDETMAHFAAVADDRAPLHEDPAFAQAVGYDAPIVQGLALASRFSRLIGMYLPGKLAILQAIDLKFHRPVHVGQPVEYVATVSRVQQALRIVRLDLTIEAASAIHVAGRAQCLVGRGAPEAHA